MELSMSDPQIPFEWRGCLTQGSHKLWKSWKTWKIAKKSSMHGKIMEFEKTLNNHGIL